MTRELIVLGSASQVPTRHRNHNGYLLRFDDEMVMVDPGEGTQRQMLFAGVPMTAVTAVGVTHFHGDHCLGLPGVLQRMSLDGVAGPVPVCFPSSGREYFDRLRHASVYEDHASVLAVPVSAPADGSLTPVLRAKTSNVTLSAAALRHRIPTVGWRLDEDAGRTMRPDLLAAAGISGPDIGRLQAAGSLQVGTRTVLLEEVSDPRPPQSVAVVMDTAWCRGALALAHGVDMLVCEATFDRAEVGLSEPARHLTAWQAGRLAHEAGARSLVITHFSQRYPDVGGLVDQAAEAYGGDIIAAEDLLRVPLPPRRSPG